MSTGTGEPQAETLEVIGSVQEYGKVAAGTLRIAIAPDASSVSLVRVSDDATKGELVAGPFTMETIRRRAENVLAGHPRAATDGKTLPMLALFACSQFLFAEKQVREQAGATTPGAAGGDVSDGAAPPPTDLAAGQPSLFGRSS